MLEQKYSTTSMTKLIKMVLLEGNLEALIECQNRVRGYNNCDSIRCIATLLC